MVPFKVLNSNNEVVFEHAVEKGDIWRMCQVKDAPNSRLGETGRKTAPH